MEPWSKRQKDLEEELCLYQIPFIDSLICFVSANPVNMNCCSVALQWENQLTLMHLTIVALALVISAFPCLGNGMKHREHRKEEEDIVIDGEQNGKQNGKQVSETMTQNTDMEADRLRCSQPIATAWLMYLCIYACVCVCGSVHLCKCEQWDNAVWAVLPTQCGNTAQLSQVQIPGTRMDRQADGETVDHKQLSAAVLKPAHSQWETYWFLFLSFSTSKDFDLQTPTWEFAMIENNPYISEMKLQKYNASSCREGFKQM